MCAAVGLAYVSISPTGSSAWTWPQSVSSVWMRIGLKYNCGGHLGFVSVSCELTKPMKDENGGNFKDDYIHTHIHAHNCCLPVIMVPITNWAPTMSELDRVLTFFLVLSIF